MGGRRRNEERVAAHGAAVPRGQAPGGIAPPEGRFGWMFPGRRACEVSPAAVDQLVRRMQRGPDGSTPTHIDLPAGFTYLGQFIDHDITFDPTPLQDRTSDPLALVNFRTPRYDLDSLYGSGPKVHPFLYDWVKEPRGTRLLIERQDAQAPDDLPRNRQGRALIGDARNDENLIVAQLHLLFIRFHNAVVDQLADERELKEPERSKIFLEAQRIVRWHYQSMVVHSFLPAVVGGTMAESVLPRAKPGESQTVQLRYFTWKREPFIPVEFSGAAFRFGHSMVRSEYVIKRPRPRDEKPRPIPFSELAGFEWLTRPKVIHWDRFFPIRGFESTQFNRSLRIDSSVSGPLFKLPEGELPRLNLERGRKLGLPSGQVVAEAMEEDALAPEALLLEEVKPEEVRRKLEDETPLWYYILCEAAHCADGKHLGPVGGRIVAEVLVGLLHGDPSSYLRQQPAWTPDDEGLVPPESAGGERPGNDKRGFTFADLVEFVDRPR